MQFGIEFSEANRFMNDDPYPQCTLGSYFTEEEKCSNLVKHSSKYINKHLAEPQHRLDIMDGSGLF